MALKQKRIGYSLRFPEDLKDDCERVAAMKSSILGKSVPLSDVLFLALEYGLPVVEDELRHRNSIQTRSKSRTEQIADMALELIQLGHRTAFPNPSPVESA